MHTPRRGDRGNVLIALKSKTRIILVIEWWQKSPRHLKLPGGGIEEGETAQEAASRELWEETGIDYPPDKLLYLAKAEGPDRENPKEIFTRHLVGAEVPESVIDSHRRIGPDEGEFVRALPLSVLNTDEFYYPHFLFLAQKLIKAV